MPERDYLPRVYQDLRAEHPGIAAAYDKLGDAGRQAGPLDEREQRLVNRRGLDDGLTRAELLHAIVIAVPTAGFPATAAAYRWACQVLDHETDAPS